MEFSFNEEALQGADKNADRITDSGAYIGVFTKVSAQTPPSGSEGLEIEFKSLTGGDATFTVWTKSKAGEQTAGFAQVQALMYLMGVKSLKPVKGKVRSWDAGSSSWIEADGDTFPDLCNKPVGVVLQKELTSKKSGGDSYRWGLYGQFQPETRLTASELRERKNKPEKLDKMLRGLKDKDGRKAQSAEPAQPSLGVEGGY